jgi:hypothetical protein
MSQRIAHNFFNNFNIIDIIIYVHLLIIIAMIAWSVADTFEGQPGDAGPYR